MDFKRSTDVVSPIPLRNRSSLYLKPILSLKGLTRDFWVKDMAITEVYCGHIYDWQLLNIAENIPNNMYVGGTIDIKNKLLLKAFSGRPDVELIYNKSSKYMFRIGLDDVNPNLIKYFLSGKYSMLFTKEQLEEAYSFRVQETVSGPDGLKSTIKSPDYVGVLKRDPKLLKSFNEALKKSFGKDIDDITYEEMQDNNIELDFPPRFKEEIYGYKEEHKELIKDGFLLI